MVSTPTPPVPKGSTTASVPLSQDTFNAYVQSTYGRYPLTIVGGEGCKLFDSNGKVREANDFRNTKCSDALGFVLCASNLVGGGLHHLSDNLAGGFLKT